MAQSLFFVSLLCFILVPSIPIGFIDGLFLSSEIDWVIIGTVIFLWKYVKFEYNISRKTLLVLGLLILIKMGLTIPYTENGLLGEYRCNTTNWEGEYEKSLEFPSIEATRIDRKIDFINSSYSFSKRHFKLGFYNNVTKYNFYMENQPKRKEMPFSVVWKGYLFVLKTQDKIFCLQTDGEAILYLDEKEIVKVSEGRFQSKSHPLLLSSGNHKILLKYSPSSLPKRNLRLLWQEKNSDKYKVIPSKNLFVFPISPSQYHLNKILLFINILLCIFVVGIVIMTLKKYKTRVEFHPSFIFVLVVLFLTVGFGYTYSKWQQPEKFILCGGSDELTYETQARTIVMEDLIGKSAFYYSPFYGYFLAILHIIFGEEIFPIILFQYLLVAFVLLFQFNISKKLFNPKIAGVGVFLTATQFSLLGFPRELYPVTLATFLLLAALYIIFLLKTEEYQLFRKRLMTAICGFLVGILIITRPNFLLHFLLFTISLLFFEKERKEKIYSISLFLFLMLIPVFSVVLRNYVVDKKPVLTTNASVNLWLGNKPPEDLVIDKDFVEKYPSFIKKDKFLVEVFEFARQRPLSFAKGIIIKFFECFGIKLNHPDKFSRIFTYCFLFLFGTILFFRQHLRLSKKWDYHTLCFSVIFLQFLILSIFFVSVCEHRLEGPVFPLMNIYGGFFLFYIGAFLKRRFMELKTIQGIFHKEVLGKGHIPFLIIFQMTFLLLLMKAM